MAISDSVQTLSAAFSLGTVLQAAITALLLYLKGHDTKLSQDRRRLVLVVFLLFAALWAQMDFFSLLVPTTKTSGCQITTTVSSAFDQIARVAIGTYLLFSIGHGTKSSAEKYVLGSLIVIRIIIGAVFVGFTRPQFAPLCVPQSSMTPIAINVIALDTIIIGILAIRIIQLGLMHSGSSQDRQAQSKALTFVTIGFTIWTATSVPMELGMSSIILLVRTAIPASGLGLLIGMLTIFPGALISHQTEDDLTSEAQSPYRPDPPRALGAYNNTGDRSGSPVITVGYGKNGRLFVTNPSVTPRDSPTRAFQSIKGDDKNKEVKVRVTEVKNGAGESSQTGASGRAGLVPAAAVALGSSGPITAVPAPSAQQKKSLFSRSRNDTRPNIRALGISQPVIDPEAANDPQAPFARMRTTDLETAAANERSRREDAAAMTPFTRVSAPLSAEEGLRKSTSTKRKEVPKPTPKYEPMPSVYSSADSIISSDISTNGANASSTSASLSPNRDEVRRRSPRHATLEEKQAYKMPPPLQQKLVVGLPTGPRSTLIARQRMVSPKAETVMLLNDIVYDNPAEVNSLINNAALLGVSPGMPIMKAKDLDRDFRDSETIPADILPDYNSTFRSIDSAKSTSILDRPRPVKRTRAKSRVLFPSDISEEVKPLTRRRSRSTGSLVMRKSMLTDNPGSPTSLGSLPPLPQPPTTASNLAKLLPKSTLDVAGGEKISMLFPAPPGALLPKRRSSVPSIPSMILDDTKSMSLISDFASNALANMEAMDEPDSPILRRETYRFSANTYQSIARTGERDSEPTIPSTQISAAPSVRNSVVNDPAPIFQSKPVTILRKPLDSEYEDEVPFSPEDDEEISVMLDSKVAGYYDGKDFFLSDDEGSEDEQHEIETPTGEDETPVGFKHFPWHRRVGDELPTFSDRRDHSRPRAMPPPPPLLLNPIGRNAMVVVRDAEPEPTDSPGRAIAEIQAQLKRFEERDRASVISLLSKFPTDGSISQTVPDDGRKKLLENLEKEMGMQENAWMELHHNIDRESTGSILTPPALPLEQVRPIRPAVSREPSNESSVSLSSLSTVAGSKQDSLSTQNQSPMLQRQASRASMWQQRLALAQEEYMSRTPEMQRKPSVNFLSLKSATTLPSTPSLLEKYSVVESRDVGKQGHSGSGGKKASLWKSASPILEQSNCLLWTHPVTTISDRSTTHEAPAASLRPRQRKEMLPLALGSSSLWMKPANSGLSATRPVVGLWGSKASRPKSIQTRPVTQRPPRRSKRITFLPDIVESPSPLPDKRGTLGLYKFPWGEKSDSAVYQPPFNSAPLIGQPAINLALQDRARELEDDEYSSSFFDDYDDEEFDDDDEDYEINQDVESDDDFDESTLWEIASLLKTREGVPSKNSLLPPPNEYINDYEYTDFEDEPDFGDGPEYVEDQSLYESSAYLPQQQRSSLWMETDESPIDSRAPGLPQPPADIWESYIPVVEEKVRSRTMSQVPLPSLASKQLWGSETGAEEFPAMVREEVAAPVKELVQGEIAAPVEEMVQYAPLPRTVFVQPAMWKRSKTPELEPDNTGLFEPDNRRTEYRTTIASPVAKDIRIQRSSTLQVPFLESADMWTAPKTKEHHVSWIDRSVAIPSSAAAVSVAIQSSTGMWTAPLKLQVDSTIGLYSPGQLSARTSDKEPAAVGLVSKPRTSRVDLPPPTSRRLWRRDNLIMIECDWISESSVRPISPSIDSIASGATSPASDRSSINSVGSASTKASSIWSTMSAATAAAVTTKPGWAVPKRKPVATLPPMPEKKDEDEKKPRFVSKLPVRQNSQKLPTPAARRESKVLANAAMFESRAQIEKVDLRRTLSASRVAVAASRFAPSPPKPAYIPLRQQFRPIFIANWDAALREAIAAGSKKQMQVVQRKALPTGLSRSKTTLAEWDSALELAITAGSQKTERRPAFVKPAASPADWDLALESAISEGYLRTARIEITNQPRTIINHMWTAPVPTPATTKSTSMWQASNLSASPKPSIFDAVRGETLRKAKPSRIAHLEKLTSHAFWRNDDQVKTAANHWLHVSKARSAATMPSIAQASRPSIQREPSDLMWIAPAHQITISSTASMWTKPARSEVVREDIFSDVAGEIIRKSKPSSSVPLPKLRSTSFWQPEKKVESSSSNWLEAHAIVRSEAPEFMWSAPSTPMDVSSTAPMWTKQEQSKVIRDDAFSSTVIETIRRTKPSSSAPLPKLRSTCFWQPEKKIKSSSSNWLEAHVIVRSEAPVMWSAPSTPMDVSSTAPMWTKQDQPKVIRDDAFSSTVIETIRRTKLSSSAPLPTLTSQTFWQPPTNIDSTPINWHEKAKSINRKPLTVPGSSIDESSLPTLTLPVISDKSLTWTAPPKAPVTATSDMWKSLPATIEKRCSVFSSIPRTTIRKSPTKNVTLPKLESTQLYEPSKEERADDHWLHISSKTLRTPTTLFIPECAGGFDFGFGTSRTTAVVKDESEIEEGAFDNVEEQGSFRMNDDFNSYEKELVSPMCNSPIEQDKETILPSSGLWTATGTGLWTPTKTEDRTSNGPEAWKLWVAARIGSSDVFGEVYKNETRHVSKRIDIEGEGIKSFELWRPSGRIPESPRNWLIQKRASKVEFRY